MDSLQSSLGSIPEELVLDIKAFALWLGAPGDQLSWVLAEGRTRFGWRALEVLFRDVTLRHAEAADVFFAFAGDTQTSWLFLEVSRGASAAMLHFTQTLHLDFDPGDFIDQMSTFRLSFMSFLPRLKNLMTFAFNVQLNSIENTFHVLTVGPFHYPKSLTTVVIRFLSPGAVEVQLVFSFLHFQS
jgi:hypothetical protein